VSPLCSLRHKRVVVQLSHLSQLGPLAKLSNVMCCY
jgi:hypothetical protein